MDCGVTISGTPQKERVKTLSEACLDQSYTTYAQPQIVPLCNGSISNFIHTELFFAIAVIASLKDLTSLRGAQRRSNPQHREGQKHEKKSFNNLIIIIYTGADIC